jgi:Ca2+-binding EF-hand superfamily protein
MNAVNYFHHFDADNSGSIDANEFQELYHNLSALGFALGDVESARKELDKDGNGEISLLEFVDWLFRIGSLAVSP